MEEGKREADTEIQTGAGCNSAEADRGGGSDIELMPQMSFFWKEHQFFPFAFFSVVFISGAWENGQKLGRSCQMYCRFPERAHKATEKREPITLKLALRFPFPERS